MNGMRSWPSTLLTISFDGAVDELGPGIQQLVPDWSMSQRVDVADVETHLGPRLGGARPARAVLGVVHQHAWHCVPGGWGSIRSRLSCASRSLGQQPLARRRGLKT